MRTELIVVIATHNRNGLLARTLCSLAECDMPENYARTIIVENGGRFGAEAIVREFHSALNAEYLYCDQPNKSKALNAVLEVVGDCLVFFTDDDVRFARGILKCYADAAARIDSGCVFGGPLGVDYEHEPPEWLKSYLPGSARGWPFRRDAPAGDKPAFCGANWAAFAQDLRNVEGFNVNKGPVTATNAVGEDTEAQDRLYQWGARAVFVRDAVVWHYVPRERCSPQWAIRRVYRHAVAQGLDSDSDAVLLFGFPRWLVRRLMEDAFRYAITRINPNERSRFDAKYRLYKSWGVMAGHRLSQRGFGSSAK